MKTLVKAVPRGWKSKAKLVLEDAPLVVIEPASGLGIAARFTGIADNFQLQMILMDVFPGDDVPRISQTAADCAWGDGPQQIDETLIGKWSMYDGFSYPKWGTGGRMAHTIWHEGMAGEIPEIDGHRVVLLGPLGFAFGFSAARMFDIGVTAEDRRIMEDSETAAWLQRLAKVND